MNIQYRLVKQFEDGFLTFDYETKNQKSLLYISENKDYRFNTWKIEVYKVLPGIPSSTELLKSRQRELVSRHA